MTRYLFPGDTVFEQDGDEVEIGDGRTCTFWSEPVGGLQYTDLQTTAGAALPGPLTADSVGTVPAVRGPNDVVLMWRDVGNALRYPVLAIDRAEALLSGDPDVLPIGTIIGLDDALAAAGTGGGGTGGSVTISGLPAGVPVVAVWDDATSQFRLNGEALGARPRTETPVLFVGGDTTDVPAWGQAGHDIHFVDGTVTLVGGGGGGGTGESYTKAEHDARFYVGPTKRWLGSYTGADATAKLRTALASYPTSGSRPTIMVDPGITLDAATTPFVIPAGFRMAGADTNETEFGYSCGVNVRHTGATTDTTKGVFQTAPPGSNDNGHKGWSMEGITWLGTASTKFLVDNPFDASRYIAYAGFWNCHWNGFQSIYWGPAKGLTVDGPGPTYMNNMANVAWYLTGSDNPNLFGNGGFFEMGAAVSYATRVALPAMIRCGNLAKTTFGPLYMTGSPTTPLRLDGGDGGITFDQMILEGRPVPGAGNLWCAGELARLTGGRSKFIGKWHGYAMRKPADNGRSPGGFYHVSGGDHEIDGGTFQPYPAANYEAYTNPAGLAIAAGVIPPLAWVSGGHLSVRGITRGPNATAKPIVMCDDASMVDADNTVQVVVF